MRSEKGQVTQIIQNTLGVVLVGFILFLLYRLILFSLVHIETMNPNVVAALIAGLSALTGYFVSRYLERKKMVEQELREKKIPTYEDFIETIFRQFKGDKPSEEELESRMLDFHKKSIIWSSDKIIRSYLKWRRTTVKAVSTPPKNHQEQVEMVGLFADFLIEIRKEVGYNKTKIKREEIMEMIIKDSRTSESTQR